MHPRGVSELKKLRKEELRSANAKTHLVADIQRLHEQVKEKLKDIIQRYKHMEDYKIRDVI
jgi:hypothetical protein